MTTSEGGWEETHLMGACLNSLLETVILSTAKDLLFLLAAGAALLTDYRR